MPKIYDNIENNLTRGLNETLNLSQRTDFVLTLGYTSNSTLTSQLICFQSSLMQLFIKNSERIVYGNAEVDQFRISPAKPIIDQIDCLLAEHYGFTQEELDFIINYDIKYRMGKELDSEEAVE